MRTLLAEVDTKALKKIIDECDVNGVTPLAWAAIGMSPMKIPQKSNTDCSLVN